LIVAAAAAWLTPGLVSAQIAGGVRGGVSVDPDQVYIGGHLETVRSSSGSSSRPNLEVGFGDELGRLSE
jgi:hypothetical protein